MADMNADARVIIKVEVNDTEANAKLAALGQKMRDLDQSNKKAKRSFDDTGKSIDKTAKNADRLAKAGKKVDEKLNELGRRMKQFGQDMNGVKTLFSSFGKALSAVFKILKYGAMEFAVMTAALGAMKVALVTGQALSKAWSWSVKAMGAAAGVAVAGIATVLGALRELQVAQMKPMYTGPLTAGLDASMVLGNKRLAMYSESLGAIMAEQMKQTGRIDAEFQQRLVRMGDFAMGDPKALQGIAAAFSLMQKKGKVTADVYSQLQSASPALAKAFEEMAGGEKKAASAAAKGSITFAAFNKALEEGKLKALAPYNGALDAINDTLIGRLKGTLTSVKEDLTQLGLGFVDLFKGPLAVAERDLQTFVMKITPTLRTVFPKLVGGIAGDAEGLLGGVLDKLAQLINNNMPKLIGFGSSLSDGWRSFKEMLGQVGDYMERFSGTASSVWENVVKPLGRELATTVNFALQNFGSMVKENSGALEQMGRTFHGIFEGVRGLIQVFSGVKQAIQPFLVGFMRFLSAFGRILNLDNVVGVLARLGVGVLAIMLVFKKFIVSLGTIKNQTVSLGQALRNLFFGTKEVDSATQKSSTATDKQAASYANMAAAVDRATLALERLLAVQTAVATKMGVPNAAGIAASGNQWGLMMPPTSAMPGMQMKPGQTWSAKAWDPKDPNAQKAWGNVLGVVAPKTLEGAGQQTAKGFKTGLKKYGAGIAMAGSMVSALGSSYLSSKFGAANTGGQALAGALGGAGTGMSIGAMFGPMGMGIGAVAGGIIGGVTSWFGANEEKKRQEEEKRKTSREAVASIMDKGGLFNTQENFTVVRDLAQFTLGELNQLTNASDAIATAFAPFKATNSLMPEANFTRDILNKAGFTFYNGKDSQGVYSEMIRTPRGVEMELADAMSNPEVMAAGAKWISDATGIAMADAIQYVAGDSGDLEWAITDLVSMSPQELQDAFGIADVADEFLADLGVSMEELTKTIQKLNTMERQRATNLMSATRILGKSGGEVEQIFTDMDRSLSKVGVSFSAFNQIMGYTGNVMADLAQGAGRLREHLLGPLEAEQSALKSEQELRGSLTKILETRGHTLSNDEASTITAETFGAIVDNATMALASGATSWEQLMGGVVTEHLPQGDRTVDYGAGSLDSQIEQLILKSQQLGLPANVQAEILRQAEVLRAQRKELTTDPFARMRADSDFAARFTGLGETLGREVLTQVGGGKDAGEALAEGTDRLVAFLEGEGFAINPEDRDALTNMLGSEALDMQIALNTAFEDGATTLSDAITTAIETGLGKETPDTATPRAGKFGDSTSARFGRTMSAHAALNGRYGGRRTVTSGVRNFALGSITSDHTTGAAFDLTGDNLLAYGKDIRDSGGFAEMHGGPDNRHLHVVPNIGDSYSPAPVAARQPVMAAAAPSGPITVNVYGSEGQSVQALADEVVDRLERRERTMRERS